MDESGIDAKELVQLARLAMLGNREDVQLFVRRLANRYRNAVPELSQQLGNLLREVPTDKSPLRRSNSESIPLDSDSKLKLVRFEQPVNVPTQPIWSPTVAARIEQILMERVHSSKLSDAGLPPTKTALFTGPPGVGKTLAARWIAHRLQRPLLTLDLSAVMSSFLGKTGNNVRSVLDYAKSMDCVLLLDEFDAIAKRRDDAVEVGELKRLVTVLLQEIDDWPQSGLLIAATNHKELLDPAVWRRFEMIVDFPMPNEDGAKVAIQRQLDNLFIDDVLVGVLTMVLKSVSYSDIERELRRVRRDAIVHGQPLELSLQVLIKDYMSNLNRSERGQIAQDLVEAGLSQRQAHELTGVSRDTIRKHGVLRNSDI